MSNEGPWLPMDHPDLPMNGIGFLAYGRHTGSPVDASPEVIAGDHWWAIILRDTWRLPKDGGDRWVFAKDGNPVWSEPLRWQKLTVPPGCE
jgi:hypothetical protein